MALWSSFRGRFYARSTTELAMVELIIHCRFGIEGLIRTKELASPEPESTFDAEHYVLTIEGPKKYSIALFEKVVVEVRMEKEESTGKRKLHLTLVKLGGK